MKKLFFIFIGTVICAPMIFLFYLKNDLVCAPRAIYSSIIFGTVPLLFLTIAIIKKKKDFYYVSLLVLIIEIVLTPVIMLKKLGWEKFVTERLLAFFTFEIIAMIQFLIIVVILRDYYKRIKNSKSIK